MSYYDPFTWVELGDNLISHIEIWMKGNKNAKAKYRNIGRGFSPPVNFEFDVVMQQGGYEIFRMTEWIDKSGRITISLSRDNKFYRNGHYNRPNYHHNPSGANVRPPHHIHFPTVKYNDINKHPNYAHPVDSENDYINTLCTFCDCVNINLGAISLPLLARK
jgi:hypothetical protein